MQRPFRFGVVVENAQSRTEWKDKAKKAEDFGYSTLLVPDHIEKDIAPITALMLAAETTTSLRIGSFVYNNDLRHPALLAKEVATLDLFSEGRFEFGLGPGYLSADYSTVGIPLEAPGVRISRFEEALSLVKKLFTEERVNFSGKYYNITDMQGKPKSFQKPHPPIYIGGGGKRILSLAAKEADIVGLAPQNSPNGLDMQTITANATANKVQWIRSAAEKRFSHLEIGCFVFRVIVTNDKYHATEKAAGFIGLPSDEVSASPHILIGSIDQIAEDIQARRELYGISYIEVLESSLEMMAPVVSRLSGT